MKKISFAILAIIIFYSCNPSIRFETPQPLNGKNVTAFKDDYIGKFASNDSTMITITTSSIIAEKTVPIQLPMSQIENSAIYKLKNDSLFARRLKTGFPIHIKRDSVTGLIHYKDTLFSIGTKNILRRYRGEYYLNVMTKEGFWDVKRLSFHAKNELVLNSVYLQDDLERLKDVTAVKEIRKDSSKIKNIYLVNPSHSELRKFIREGGFRRYDMFTKVIAKK
jgi:hypothetical protein